MSHRKVFLGIKLVLTLFACNISTSDVKIKRGVFDYNDALRSYGNLPPHFQFHSAPAPQLLYPKPLVVPIKNKQDYISTAQIASAIQAAKEASAAVVAAQQRVQQAKDVLLHQQHLANQKETAALLAQQKVEAAAAVQRQEAKSAATAVVMAQQRLAQAKADVAKQQKIAAIKESHAAAILQKSAAFAETEIEKSDHAAEKISAIQNAQLNGVKQASISKDASLSAASVAVAASSGHSGGFSHPAWVVHSAPHPGDFYFSQWH